MRILVVEDEIRIRKGMANLIENHTVHTVIGEAQNGKEGMEMALLYAPDLIITDIRMPEMDGLEMMKRLREKGGEWHFVILSGYSEFEYAQKAIQYGADDYLIKPLAPDDVVELLDTIQQKLKKDKLKKQEKPERILRNYLVEKEDIPTEYLMEICGFNIVCSIRVISAYVGNLSKEDRTSCIDRLQNIRDKFQDEKVYYFFTESTREFIVVFDARIWEFLKKELELKLLGRKRGEQDWIWMSAEAGPLEKIRETYEELKKGYEYALVLNTDRILEDSDICNFKAETYESSQKRKKNIQECFYKKDKERLRKEMEDFRREIEESRANPKQIKEEYMKMAYFLLDLAKDGDNRIYEQLQNSNVIKNIGNGVTHKELQDIFVHIGQVFESNMNERENISNYVILRAIDYIRKHYQEGISLEEIAGKLDITPEYLSTLFNREVGEKFSVFLKKFRISHAKRLLRETDKKIVEISSETGYTDPKYFSRVFKEVEGISPGEFRALNKKD